MEKLSKMLIIDDEIEILRVLREVFELRGWDVIVAPTGSAVWPILEKEKMDIVLLDIKLPDCDGLDILGQVKRKYPAIPVVIVTALGYKDELVNRAMQLGAAGYVSKGIPLNELIEIVNNALMK